jgi:hypothetical protein
MAQSQYPPSKIGGNNIQKQSLINFIFPLFISSYPHTDCKLCAIAKVNTLHPISFFSFFKKINSFHFLPHSSQPPQPKFQHALSGQG